MITIRARALLISPLTLIEIGSVLESVRVLGTCTPTVKVLLPENFPHLVRVVAVVAHREIPDASLDEVSAALNIDNIANVLNALTSGHYPSLAEVHKEQSNVRN